MFPYNVSKDFEQKFKAMAKRSDIADLLGLSENQLCHVLYVLEPKYTEFSIPKRSGGKRKISAPNSQLKTIQKRLSNVLQQIYEVKPSVFGFIQGRSILGNAKAHKKKSFVLNLDLKDFFPSIHMGRVKGIFHNPPYNLPENVAKVLAQICCTYEGLPQGAPSSPVVSNIICRKMDSQLQKIAMRHKCFYTRYADDITFSTSLVKFPSALATFIDGQLSLGDELSSVIQSNGFQVNPDKIRLRSHAQRQEVTGLTVNRFPNVNREFIRQIRAMLSDWRKLGENEALKRHLSLHPSSYRLKPSAYQFRDIIRGKLAYLAMIKGKRDNVYKGLVDQVRQIDAKFAATFEVEGPIKVFLNYAREDETSVGHISEFLSSSSINTWMDRSKIKAGDEWEKQITKAIEDCDVFIACSSKRSVTKKGYVQIEIEQAVSQHKLVGKPYKIIPFRLNECELQSALAEFHFIDYFQKGSLQQLKEAILAFQER